MEVNNMPEPLSRRQQQSNRTAGFDLGKEVKIGGTWVGDMEKGDLSTGKV